MKKAGLVCSLVVMVFSLSCGHPTALVSMSVTPSSATVVGIIPVQYTAYGNYIHPTETRDITTQVKWTSSVPMVATVNANGVVIPAGAACGGTTITATAGKDLVGPGSSQAEMSAAAMFIVADPNTKGCPTGQ